MKNNKNNPFIPITIIVVILTICLFHKPYMAIINHMLPTAIPSAKTISIDPGHGGYDPGKVGIDGTLEKDINLSIALLLKECLEKKHYKVVITRDSDMHLYTEGCANKKTDDLNRRIKMIEDASSDIAISIHQNSFGDSSVSGPQVFFFNNAAESERLAKSIQSSLITAIAPSCSRKEKSNSNYYMLKNTSCPIVIVECGFLSSPSESALLKDRKYQMQTAEAICTGISDYFKSTD